MTVRGVVLVAMAALLAGLLTFELGEGSDVGSVSSIAASPAAPVASAEAQLRPGVDRTAVWVATILARPLFSPDRRPPTEAAPMPAAVASPEDDTPPRLTGVLVSAQGRTAIFADPAGGKPIVLEEGGRLGRFTVQTIEAGQVTLAGPAGVAVLRPAFAAGGAAGETASTVPTPPASPPPASPVKTAP
jgi:hypothetical protein